MKKINKKYADLLHQASIATGRKEAVGLLHKAAKLKTKFDQKSKIQVSLCLIFDINFGEIKAFIMFFPTKEFLGNLFELCREYQEAIPAYKMAEIFRDYANKLDG